MTGAFSLRFVDHTTFEYGNYFGSYSKQSNSYPTPRECVLAYLRHTYLLQKLMDASQPGLEAMLRTQAAFVVDGNNEIVKVISFRVPRPGESRLPVAIILSVLTGQVVCERTAESILIIRDN